MLEIDFQPGLERVRETSRPRCDPQMLSPGDGESGDGGDGGDNDDDITMVSGDVDADYLLACFNVPEDTRHVAAGGEDLIVVQEPENWIFRKNCYFVLEPTKSVIFGKY